MERGIKVVLGILFVLGAWWLATHFGVWERGSLKITVGEPPLNKMMIQPEWFQDPSIKAVEVAVGKWDDGGPILLKITARHKNGAEKRLTFYCIYPPEEN